MGRPSSSLPTTRRDLEDRGWDRCDVVLVTGDAYVDHPSFGAAVIGRVLEAEGFRVGIVAQPDWRGTDDFAALGVPRLFWGVTAGNMDSLVNRYTSDRRIRAEDAYTANGEPGRRPDRAVIVYSQRCREVGGSVPVIIGGIEASLRRVAHYDYWSEKVRRSVLFDAKANLLVFGNAERTIVALAKRLQDGDSIERVQDVRGTAFIREAGAHAFVEVDSSTVEPVDPQAEEVRADPYAAVEVASCAAEEKAPLVQLRAPRGAASRGRTVLRLPSAEAVKEDPVLYAHASRIVHRESNPGNARPLVQRHGDKDLWVNPPALPLSTAEMDRVFELPYQRRPHPRYADARIPAYEMIKTSVTIMRGCFGGCTFCSITEHEGRIIQSRSEASILREMEAIRDQVPGFTGVISDLGGPTANMWRMACKSREIESACRRLSCVYPGICENLSTDHGPLVQLYRKARAVPGIKKVFVASGVRYDLAVRSPEYVRELAQHHTGGYLKVAPEHIASGPLRHMMKPGVKTYERFRQMFEEASRSVGKQQYLIPYFIAAHPGTTDEDMLELALWLKRNKLRPDQVQTFLPSPMATATAMYHTGKNPLVRQSRTPGHADVVTPRGTRVRRLHKAFLRYHDPENWPLLRAALRAMGRTDLIGSKPSQLVPHEGAHVTVAPMRGAKTTKGRGRQARVGRR